MTERQAWLYLAEKWTEGTLPPWGCHCSVETWIGVSLTGDEWEAGLCDSVDTMEEEGRLNPGVWAKMKARLLWFKPKSVRKDKYWWGHTPACAEKRVWVCLMLAAACR